MSQARREREAGLLLRLCECSDEHRLFVRTKAKQSKTKRAGLAIRSLSGPQRPFSGFAPLGPRDGDTPRNARCGE